MSKESPDKCTALLPPISYVDARIPSAKICGKVRGRRAHSVFRGKYYLYAENFKNMFVCIGNLLLGFTE